MRYWSFLTVFLFAVFSFGAVSGSDNTQFDPIGYSPDGLFFAYEEFGIGEKSGLAYSNIYVVDLARNKWVLGAPVYYKALRSSETLAQARQKARAGANSLLADLELEVPAIIVAMTGDGEPEAQRSSLLFGVPGNGVQGTVIGQYLLTLKSFETGAAAPCWQWFEQKPLGFSVDMENYGRTLQVYKDTMLPRSRGCPFDYRFSAVIMPFGATDISNSLAMVAVFTHGLEEARKQYLAVPLGFRITGND